MADAATVQLDETPPASAPPRDPIQPAEDAVAREPDDADDRPPPGGATA